MGCFQADPWFGFGPLDSSNRDSNMSHLGVTMVIQTRILLYRSGSGFLYVASIECISYSTCFINRSDIGWTSAQRHASSTRPVLIGPNWISTRTLNRYESSWWATVHPNFFSGPTQNVNLFQNSYEYFSLLQNQYFFKLQLRNRGFLKLQIPQGLLKD